MLFVGLLGLWASYGLGSWGWCLNRGYNITLREWLSPLHPFDWPANGADPKYIPCGRIFPALNMGVDNMPDCSSGGMGGAPGSGPGPGAQYSKALGGWVPPQSQTPTQGPNPLAGAST